MRCLVTVVTVFVVVATGGTCKPDKNQEKSAAPVATPSAPKPQQSENSKPALPPQPKPKTLPDKPSLSPTMTARENPTTAAGRGEPSLDDHLRPAAWIYVDGRPGVFKEQDGRPLLQWYTEGEVGPKPTFRVEVYQPVFGNPKEFQCVLQTAESPTGQRVNYAISANEGTFEVGKEYSILSPGENFSILDNSTRTTLPKIPELSPGTYGLVASITNAQTGAKGLAVTYFTVGSSAAGGRQKTADDQK